MGKLYLITLPIGNLADITERAKNHLNLSGIFLCEDTRNLKKLLSLYEISVEGKEFYSLHDHSGLEYLEKLANYLETQDLYLVSDAGSPVISDPAFDFIKIIQEKGYDWESAPGVSSVTTALELSGLSPLPFFFWGFLPRKKEEIKKFLLSLRVMKGTHLFFESPKRVQQSLSLLGDLFPDDRIAVMRELTKKFQSVHRFKGSEVAEKINDIHLKGEFVLGLEINKVIQSDIMGGEEIKNLALQVMESKGKTKPLSKLLSKVLDRNAKEIYQDLNS